MNLNDYKGILVYAEQRDGVLQNVGLELLGKATELAYEINKQIALKNTGDELADYATKQAAAIKSIDAVVATLEEDDEEIKESSYKDFLYWLLIDFLNEVEDEKSSRVL